VGMCHVGVKREIWDVYSLLRIMHTCTDVGFCQVRGGAGGLRGWRDGEVSLGCSTCNCLSWDVCRLLRVMHTCTDAGFCQVRGGAGEGGRVCICQGGQAVVWTVLYKMCAACCSVGVSLCDCAVQELYRSCH
jgi:hypothetical protein